MSPVSGACGCEGAVLPRRVFGLQGFFWRGLRGAEAAMLWSQEQSLTGRLSRPLLEDSSPGDSVLTAANPAPGHFD